MELIISLLVKFRQFTVLGILIIVGFIINLFDKKIDNRVNFKYEE